MILVVGDVMTDILVRPEGAAAPGTDQRARIERRPGGSGANIACWLGHAGAATRFAGRVGAADHAAHEAAFRAHGVQPRLAADPRHETGTVVAMLGEDGARGFYTDRAANLALCEADLPGSLLDGVRALHVSGHVFFAPGPRAAAQALMATARARDISVSVDAGSAGWLSRLAPGAFESWTQTAGLCFANADEAAFVGAAFDMFVVTHGPAGAAAHHRGQVVRTPAAHAVVRDGAGAGDAFAAGFLAARENGASLAACLAAAAELAGRCVECAGGRPPG